MFDVAVPIVCSIYLPVPGYRRAQWQARPFASSKFMPGPLRLLRLHWRRGEPSIETIGKHFFAAWLHREY